MSVLGTTQPALYSGAMGRLSTHVLDTAVGKPARGVKITISRLEDGRARELGVFTTNEDGRTDQPVLSGAALVAGDYEIVFHLGAYFAGTPAFFETIPIRFRVIDPDGHYHVPLVCSPWAYSTYRGS